MSTERSAGVVTTDTALRLSRPATLDTLSEFMALADLACAQAGADEHVSYAVRLAVEEVIANIISHGYGPGRSGPVDLMIDFDSSRIRIEIRDRAERFVPADVPVPDLESPWQTRNPGGIGWALVTQMMDSIEHQYDPALGNRLTLTKHLTS